MFKIIALFFAVSAGASFLVAFAWSLGNVGAALAIFPSTLILGHILMSPAILFYLTSFLLLWRSKHMEMGPLLRYGVVPCFIIGSVVAFLFGGEKDAWIVIAIIATFTLSGLLTVYVHSMLVRRFWLPGSK